jgi:hypothetical protein
MLTPLPVIGEWFQGPSGELFEVVAIDHDDDTIEVQYFDGTLEEFDSETWAAQGVIEADPPEDWTGSVDMEPEDYELETKIANSETWSAPLEYLDRNETGGYSELTFGVQTRHSH